MHYQLLHELTFYAMFAALALASFVIVERMIFYVFTLRRSRALEVLLTTTDHHPAHIASQFETGNSVPGETLQRMVENRQRMRNRHELEDLSEAIYLAMKAKLQRHLWVLDTVVTAAPLLGLLGTILGIIDTFSALAQSGVSDPSSVSAGIGTALFATALGIGIALFGLIFFNLFQERVERISEHLKIIILYTGLGILPTPDLEFTHAAHPVPAPA
ncbi:MAG: MotA/TolQ/ExbB proton channel family protein [Sulfurimicrobium sp.]|nr:MotA/TolQ/ExbB proton channel family protein [Sulfurimicrobium sp.]